VRAVIRGQFNVHAIDVARPFVDTPPGRKKDLIGIDPKHRPTFRTKLEVALELLR
jgi:hypothetical protein